MWNLSHCSASNGGKVSHEAGVKVLERLLGRNYSLRSRCGDGAAV